MSHKARRLTADDLLRPFPVTCATCRGPATCYPKGTFCPTCSPAWLGSFMAYLLNQERRAVGLPDLDADASGE